MMWKHKQGSIGYSSWVRSYKQTLSTELNSRISLHAALEEVRIYEDGRVEKNRDLPPVVIFLDELAMGTAVAEALTKLIGDRVAG